MITSKPDNWESLNVFWAQNYKTELNLYPPLGLNVDFFHMFSQVFSSFFSDFSLSHLGLTAAKLCLKSSGCKLLTERFENLAAWKFPMQNRQGARLHQSIDIFIWDCPHYLTDIICRQGRKQDQTDSRRKKRKVNKEKRIKLKDQMRLQCLSYLKHKIKS